MLGEYFLSCGCCGYYSNPIPYRFVKGAPASAVLPVVEPRRRIVVGHAQEVSELEWEKIFQGDDKFGDKILSDFFDKLSRTGVRVTIPQHEKDDRYSLNPPFQCPKCNATLIATSGKKHKLESEASNVQELLRRSYDSGHQVKMRTSNGSKIMCYCGDIEPGQVLYQIRIVNKDEFARKETVREVREDLANFNLRCDIDEVSSMTTNLDVFQNDCPGPV